MHRDGTGVSKNLTLAYGLFAKASLQSAWPAQMELGVMLANGDGCERDLIEGLAWLVVAAESSDLAATSRDRLIKVLSPYDVAAARRRAVELKTKLELIRSNPSK